jgi:hypothetical protein
MVLGLGGTSVLLFLSAEDVGKGLEGFDITGRNGTCSKTEFY